MKEAVIRYLLLVLVWPLFLEGQPIRTAVHYLWNNDQWAPQLNDSNFIDGNQFVVGTRHRWYNDTHSVWQHYADHTYTNSISGEVLREEFTKLNNITGEWVTHVKDFTYNNAGKVSSSNWYSNTGDSLVVTTTVGYLYDAAGFLICDSVMNLTDTGWCTTGRNTYTNNSQGLVERHHFRSFWQGKWNDIRLYLNAYDTNGRLLETLIQASNGNVFIDYHKLIHTYNNDGSLKWTDDYVAYGHLWYFVERHDLHYYPDGNLHYEQWWSDKGNKKKIVYTYFDKPGTGLSELEPGKEKLSYYFDMSGNPVKKTSNTVLIERSGKKVRKVLFLGP